MPPRVLDPRDLSAIAVAGVKLHRIRHALGISAFGTNGYAADDGELLIEDHDEASGPGHEELYVVLHGSARFTVDGEDVDVPAGSLLLVAPPQQRTAVATADGTFALVIGGPPGAAGPVSAWEYRFAAGGESDPESAYAVVAEGLAEHPDDPALHFHLARYALRAGREEQAREHLQRAIAADPRERDYALEDPELAELVS